jgi:hemerythrin
MFDWQPEYSVGFDEIDRLHRRVFAAAADLHAAVVAGRPSGALAELFARLAAEARSHFAAEEALMRSSQYPHFTRHEAKHRALDEKLDALKPTVETLRALKDWVSEHIAAEDRQLAGYLAARAGA